MDCGNKNATVITNQRVLIHSKDLRLPQNIVQENAVIIQPCYLGENVVLKNTVIGPHVSLGKNSKIENSVIENSIIGENVSISFAVLPTPW
jgi:glucose-1-phosphate thymidylyltransferase